MNNKKNLSQTSWEKNKSFSNGLNKVEGILTSTLQIKHDLTSPYCYAFFQLEGISQDIPVIFKLADSVNLEENKPDIPPRAKVLLEGKWAESSNSTRPSFTCLAWEIVSVLPPLTVKELREQISQLLNISLDKKKEWLERTDYLFRKRKDLEEIEKLTRLGEEYLSAYLLVRKAFYSNYQDNLLPLNHWNQEEYLAKISQEIEEVAQHIRAYQSKDLF